MTTVSIKMRYKAKETSTARQLNYMLKNVSIGVKSDLVVS